MGRRLLYEGELVYGRQFSVKDGALTEAEAQRHQLISEGWGGKVA